MVMAAAVGPRIPPLVGAVGLTPHASAPGVPIRTTCPEVASIGGCARATVWATTAVVSPSM